MPDPECPVCRGQDLGTTDGADGQQHPLVCGVCTLPPSVLEDDEVDEP